MDQIERMNAAKAARRHQGLGSVRKVAVHARVADGHAKQRRELMKAIALLAGWVGSDLIATVHFCRLDNDELREMIEAQFNVIAAGVS